MEVHVHDRGYLLREPRVPRIPSLILQALWLYEKSVAYFAEGLH